MVKEFSFFVERGDVRKQSKDARLSSATMKEGEERLAFAKGLAGTAKPKYVLENAYEAMREAADALLYLDGFKSYSHEASIAYLLGKGFPESELAEFDRFRRIRNGIKYYGGECEPDDALAALRLAESVITRVRKAIRNR